MSSPNSQTELQSHILERLTKAQEAPEPDDKVQNKFAQDLCDLIDARLKDSVHHKLETQFTGTSSQRLDHFVTSPNNTTPVSVFHTRQSDLIALLRCEPTTAAVMAGLYFGSDLDNDVTESDVKHSPAELALINMLAKEISKALTKKISITSTVSTVVRENLEEDGISDTPAIICNFEMNSLGSNCKLALAIPQHLIIAEEISRPQPSDSPGMYRTDELNQMGVVASIELKARPTILEKIRDLAVGDCLPLDCTNTLQGRFSIRGKELYSGEIGRTGDSFSFKLTNAATVELEGTDPTKLQSPLLQTHE